METKQRKPLYDFTNRTVTWTFDSMPALVLHMDKVSEENKLRSSYVGFGQVRVKDASAIGQADSKGNIIAPAIRERTKHERMSAIVTHLESGSTEWSLKAGPRVVKGPDYDLIRLGLARAGMSSDKVVAMDEATLQRMTTVGKVAEAMAMIAAERITPVADAEKEFENMLAG